MGPDEESRSKICSHSLILDLNVPQGIHLPWPCHSEAVSLLPILMVFHRAHVIISATASRCIQVLIPETCECYRLWKKGL